MADKPEEQRRGPGRPPNPPPAPARPAPRVRGDANAVVRELGGRSVTVKLYRREGMDWAYLDTADGAGMTLDTVRELYGAGRYQVRWEEEDASEKEKEFSIARRVDEGPAKSTADALMMKVLDRLERIERGGNQPARDDRILELLLRDRTATPARDPMLDTLVQALIARNNQPAGNGAMDIMAVLKLVEDARNNGMSVAEKLAAMGGGDSTAALYQTIRDVGAPLANALGERMRSEGPGRRYVRSLPATTGDTTVPKWVTDLKQYERFIVGWARDDADADAVARRVLDGLDEAQFTELGTTLTGNDDAQLVKLLVVGLPPLAGYPGWLRRVVVEVRRMHGEAIEPEPVTKPKRAAKKTAAKGGATDGGE